jgi:polysaccharide export outer membrane protein
MLPSLIVAVACALIQANPAPDVIRATVNSGSFYVQGAVQHPGEFPLRKNLTILDAVALAGGFRDFAKKKKMYLLHGTQRIDFDYQQVVRGQSTEQNVPIQNGDHIVVPEG